MKIRCIIKEIFVVIGSLCSISSKKRRGSMYSANTVAKYVINRCNRLGRTISNLKLQKILYFVQAEFLVTQNVPCFPEHIEAWDFGPVIPTVYHRFKVYGSASIPSIDTDSSIPFSRTDKKLLDGIIDECSKYSASTLVEITHRQTPWKQAYRPYGSSNISNESIKKFFQEA